MRGKSRLQTWCYACSTVSASSASASAIRNARSDKQIEAALVLTASRICRSLRSFWLGAQAAVQSIVSRTTWHVNHWITLNRCIIWKLQNGRTTIHTRANCSRQPEHQARTHSRPCAMVAITIITCIDTNLNKTVNYVNSDAAANAKQTNVDILYAHLYPISHTIIKLVPLRTSTPSKSGQQQTGFFSADGVTPLGSVYWRGVLRLSSSLRAFRNLSQWHQRTLGFDPWQHGRIMTQQEIVKKCEMMRKNVTNMSGNFPQASTKTLRIIRIASQLTCPSS